MEASLNEGDMLRSPSKGAPLHAPVEDGERITLLDVVRGFAIFGLALVKAADFSPDFWAAWPAPVDRGLAWFEENFLADKFFTLFAILFGIGFSIQMHRAVARATVFPRYYVRRSLVLLGIGLLHGLFLWSGDILAGYAIVSFALLLFRRATNRTLLITAAIAWLTAYVVWIGRMLLQIPRPDMPDPARVTALLSSGPALEILRYQSSATLDYLSRGIIGPGTWMPSVLCLFLLGLYLERAGIVGRIARDRSFCRRGLIVALAIALAGGVLEALLSSVWPTDDLRIVRRLIIGIFGSLATFGLSAAYALGLALLLLRGRPALPLTGLAAVGRTALSNYLLQSVVFVLLYYSYGLGLYGRITPLPAMLLSVTVYSAQVLLSIWWLNRFRFGPVEWAWRSLTYGRKQAFRS